MHAPEKICPYSKRKSAARDQVVTLPDAACRSDTYCNFVQYKCTETETQAKISQVCRIFGTTAFFYKKATDTLQKLYKTKEEDCGRSKMGPAMILPKLYKNLTPT